MGFHKLKNIFTPCMFPLWNESLSRIFNLIQSQLLKYVSLIGFWKCGTMICLIMFGLQNPLSSLISNTIKSQSLKYKVYIIFHKPSPFIPLPSQLREIFTHCRYAFIYSSNGWSCLKFNLFSANVKIVWNRATFLSEIICRLWFFVLWHGWESTSWGCWWFSYIISRLVFFYAHTWIT